MENEENQNDLNNKETPPPTDTGQSEQNEGSNSNQGETLEELQARLAKVEAERDNYREAVIKKRDLEKQQKEETPPAGNEGSDTLTKDEVSDLVKQGIGEYQTTHRKAMQSKAIERVLSQEGHKEYADDNNWSRAIDNLNLTGNEVTVEDYEARIKEAILLDKHRTGKLDEYIESEKKRAEQLGQYRATVGIGLEAGGTGTQSGGEHSGNTLTPERERMARFMRNDPSKVKDIDLSKDNEISTI